MELRERVKEVVERLKPRLEELAEGHVQLIEVDEGRGMVRVKLIGGRLC